MSIVLLPIIFFNFVPDSVSHIDNRKLAENPFTTEGDLTENIENYINDRIGFRDSLISAYTILNDKLFDKMVHPSYTYGKDGYVFGSKLTSTNEFGDYFIVFADMIEAIQEYCSSRNVPFLFVFNPAKTAIYQDKLPNGVNFNREWVNQFFSELDKRGINYLDNTETLMELSASGIEGFNQKYDANHWNDVGAFYGTQKMLERLKEEIPSVHINDISEFTVSQTLRTSLLVSNFPINEYVPLIELNVQYEDLSNQYSSVIKLDSFYRGFGYYINSERLNEGTPKLLSFQGSYMNAYGYKFMINSFGEYIYVHDYQNVIDFPYYFNIFQPDCVIFEVAENTFSNEYFNYNMMKEINYNPSLSSLSDSDYTLVNIADEDISIEKNGTLTRITWKTNSSYSYVWFELDKTYDMKSIEGGYQVTIETNEYEKTDSNIKILVME